MRRIATAIFGLLAVVSVLLPLQGAQGADITIAPRLFGGTLVHISGRIFPGDETKFAAKTASIADRTNTLIWLTSPGGNVFAALAIAQLIRDRGYSTMVNRLGGCASACPLIWFSGRHAIIQRNSLLVFHMPYDARNGQPSPEAIEVVVAYLQTVGLTKSQAHFLATAAAPSDGWVATEAAAFALGFRPQIILSPLAARTCQAKFCLAIP
jgi:hypothetical protein